MPLHQNINENTKQKLNVWVDKSLMPQIDGVCAGDDCCRATIVKNAPNSYFKNSNSQDLQLTAINARFDALEAQKQTRTTLILDSIKNQQIEIRLKINYWKAKKEEKINFKKAI